MSTSIATTSIKLVDGKYYRVTLTGGDEGYGDAARVHVFDKSGKAVDIEAGYERALGRSVEEWVAKVPIDKLRQAGLDVNSLGITSCLKRPAGDEVWEFVDHEVKNGPTDHVESSYGETRPDRLVTRGVDMFCGRMDVKICATASSGRHTYDTGIYVHAVSLRDDNNFFGGAAEVKVSLVPKMVAHKSGRPNVIVNSWLDARNIAVITLKRQADGAYVSASLDDQHAYLKASACNDAHQPTQAAVAALMVAAYVPGENKIDSRYESMYEIPIR